MLKNDIRASVYFENSKLMVLYLYECENKLPKCVVNKAQYVEESYESFYFENSKVMVLYLYEIWKTKSLSAP